MDAVGNVFVADFTSNAVKEIVAVNGTVSSSSAVNMVGGGFNGPAAVAVDAVGNIFVADYTNNAIKEIVAVNGAVSSSSTVNALGSGFSNPGGVAVDGRGNVFVADQNNNAVKEIDFADPPSLSFSSTAVGATSSDSPKTVTVTNNGNATLTFPVPTTGLNPSLSTGFTFGNSSTCSQLTTLSSIATLAAATSCTVLLSFQPTVAGTISGSLVLTDNHLNAVSPTYATQSVSLSGTAVQALASFAFTGLPASTTAGTPLAFTLIASASSNTTVTGYLGTAQLTSNDPNAAFSLTSGGPPVTSYTFTSSDSGIHLLYVTFKTAGSAQSIAATDTSLAVSGTGGAVAVLAGPVANIVSTGPLTRSAVIGNSFNSLAVKITDAFGNPVPAWPVSFSFPRSGPTLDAGTSSVGTTSTSGITQEADYANSIVGGPYTVVATTVGLNTSVTWTLTNLISPTSSAVAVSPTTTVPYGTPAALLATITPNFAYKRIGPPTGTVSFYDNINSTQRSLGTTTIGGTVGVSSYAVFHPFGPTNSAAVPATVAFNVTAPLPGLHTYSAVYNADGNFTTSTSGNATLTVTQASATIAGPSVQPVAVTLGAGPSIPIQIVGALSGSGILPPSGAVTYTILNATGASVGTGTVHLTAGSSAGLGNIAVPSSLPAGVYTVTFAYAGDTNYTAAAGSLAFTITSATATALTASSTTSTYGQPVTLTATITPSSTGTIGGVVNVSFYSGTILLGTGVLNPSGIATLSLATLPVGQNTLTAAYPGSAFFSASTSPALAVSSRAVSVTTLFAAPTTQLFDNPVTLTAHVASAFGGAPAGTITFVDGSAVIGTAALDANDNAVFSTTSLADGPHGLSATYSGDPNHLPGASAATATNITVSDLNLNLGGDQNHTVVPGAAVDYNFPLSPLVTPTFVYDVQLTATGIPPGATYTFTPAMIPAGSGSLPVKLTVQTAKSTASLRHGLRPWSRGSLATLAFTVFLPLLATGRVRRRLRSMPTPLAMTLCALLGLGAMTGLSGCGAGGFFGPTATSGHYTITVTATSADLVRTSTVQLTIQ